MVSISIFTMVMIVAVGSVFAIVDANKKTHSIKSVMTNLNFALESMTRDIRVGTMYGCDTAVGTPGDCQSGGDTFHFKANRDVDGNGLADDFIEYSLGQENGVWKIMKGVYPAGIVFPITAAEIHIESMKFYVTGTRADDGVQPKAVITIRGYAGVSGTLSKFNIQTTVSERALDI